MAEFTSNLVPFEVLEDEDESQRTGLELQVFAHDDPTKLLDTLPGRTGLSTLDEIRGPGGGSFSISRNDPKLIAYPDLLAYRNICKVLLDQKPVGAFLIQRKKAEYVSSKEASGEIWQVSGSGLREWFKDAVVYPYRGLKDDSQSSRVFSFASERGSWYVPADWKTPVVVQSYNMDPNDGPFGTAPAEWPDAPNAKWIWGSANSKTDPAPEGVNFFRYEFTVAESVGKKSYSFFASGRTDFDVFLDGQSIIEARGTDSYAQTWRADFEIGPGEHVLAARVRADGTRASAFIGAFYRAGDATAGTSAELLNVTNTTSWAVNPYPDPAPGWTPGEIVLTLLEEAEDRGVRFPSFLTPTFTAELDSEGHSWERALDWSFDLGTEYYDVIEQLEEIVCDVWIDPATLELNMYANRGVHRDVQSVAVQPVKFEIGRNVTKANEEGSSDIKNALMMSTEDGWGDLADGLSSSQSTYGRVEGYVSTGASKAVSGDVAQSVFTQRAEPEITATYEIVDVDDARPHFDFFVGDWTLAPSAEDDTNLVQRRVMSIAIMENDDTGLPKFAVEFDTIFQDAETRYDRWLRKTGDGTLGGTLANVSVGGGGGGSSSPTSQSVQRGPQGLEGPRGFPGFDYQGVWVPGSYGVSDVVFYNNKFWVADGQTTETPSSSAVHWDELTVTPSTPPSSGITVYLAANYNAPIAATAIPWSGESFKSGITHDTNSTDIVISDAGPYFISGSIQSTLGSSSQAREFQVQVNGVVVASAKSSPSSSSPTTAFADLPGVFLNLATGDVVRLVSSGTAIHVIPTGTTAWFSLAKVSGVQGPAGPTGPAGAIASATATALAAGAAPTVTLGGTPQARTMEFGIPAGAKGDTGDKGDSGTITSASAASLPAGAVPTVTLGGTPQARTMEFGIPAGEKGDKGDPGAPLNFRGAWSSSVSYVPGDTVEYAGSLWVTGTANTNKTPGVATEWVEYAGGGWKRATASLISSALAPAALQKTAIPLARSYRLFKISTDKAARVRLYATAAQRDADEARAIGTDPTGDHGLIFEFVTTTLLLSAVLSPFVDGSSMESAPSANIPISITNLSGTSATVKVDLTYVRTE